MNFDDNFSNCCLLSYFKNHILPHSCFYPSRAFHVHRMSTDVKPKMWKFILEFLILVTLLTTSFARIVLQDTLGDDENFDNPARVVVVEAEEEVPSEVKLDNIDVIQVHSEGLAIGRAGDDDDYDDTNDTTTSGPLPYTGQMIPRHGNEPREDRLSRNQVVWVYTGVELFIFLLMIIFFLCWSYCRKRRQLEREKAAATSIPPSSASHEA